MIQDGVDKRSRCLIRSRAVPTRRSPTMLLQYNGRTTEAKRSREISGTPAPRLTLRSRESRCGEVGSERTSRRFGLLVVPLRLVSLSSSFFSRPVSRIRVALSRLLLLIRTARQMKYDPRKPRIWRRQSARSGTLRSRNDGSRRSCSLLVYLVRTLVSLPLSLSFSLPTVVARLKSI